MATVKIIVDNPLPDHPEKKNDPLIALLERTPEEILIDRQRILAAARKARPLPPGKTLEDVIVGALSDDKTDGDLLVNMATHS